MDLNEHRGGAAGGPRVLLLHGLQSSGATWWRIASALAEAGADVTAPTSAATARARAASATASATSSATSDTGLGARNGHSLGGALAAQALADDPDFARRTVLLDPVLEIPDGEFEAILAEQLAERTLDAERIPGRQPALAPGLHPPQARGLGRLRARDRRGGAARQPPVGSCAPARHPARDPRRRPRPRRGVHAQRPPAATGCSPAPATRRTATTRTPSSRPWMPVSKGEPIDLERTRGKVLKAATKLFYRDGTHAGIMSSPNAPGSPNSRCTAISAARKACWKRFCASAATASSAG